MPPLLLLSLLQACSITKAQPLDPVSSQEPTMATPFDDVRWMNAQPQVRVGQAWYEPVSIDGMSVSRILDRCSSAWPGKREKRFEEDLMEAMALLGQTPGGEVTLVLRALDTGEEVILEAVTNTKAKRNALRDRPRTMLASSSLTPAEVERDVQSFEDGLRARFSYLEMRGLDLSAAVEAELSRTPDQETDTISELAEHLHRVLMQFGDGHASVDAPDFNPGNIGPYLPFLLSDSADGVVAYAADRHQYLDPEHPLVVSLDGVSIEDGLRRGQALVPQGSSQAIRTRSMRNMRDITTWHPRYIAPGDSIVVELSSLDGQHRRVVEVEASHHKPIYGTWPQAESRILDEGIGYLRLPWMDDAATAEILKWMPQFKDTSALIVDVRGNQGGSREPLLTLAGFLWGPGDGPVVGSFAAYRLNEAFGDDHLEARYMRRLDSPEWTPAQSAAIQAEFSMFTPEWSLPAGFSEWHALLLGPTGRDREYHYQQPIIVLVDELCFSATDIFLGALERHPQVTLMGRASSGGSARVQDFYLPESGIAVSCASMASFRPDGRLYDGRGIEVDEQILPASSFVLVDGEDRVLEAAVRRLQVPAAD